LYAGLSGGFGGADYMGTYEFNTIEEATNEAYLLACEVYESYEGYHGIMSWEECREALIESYYEENDDDDEHSYIPEEEEVNIYYIEEKEGWLSYYAIPADEDDNVDLD
jgi:hypothetical protein